MPLHIPSFRRLAVALTVAALAPAAHAVSIVPVPDGPQLAIAGSEQEPPGSALVAGREDGSFVAAYTLEADAGNAVAAVREVGADGSPGPEIRLDPLWPDAARASDVAILADGTAVVVWGRWGEVGGTPEFPVWAFQGAWAQRFAPGGVALGAPVRLDGEPAAAGGARVEPQGDGFVAVWSFAGSMGSGVAMRRFTADGTPRAPAVEVSPAILLLGKVDPDVAVVPDGTIAVSWRTVAQRPRRNSATARLLAADGTPVGDEILLDYALADELPPRVAARPAGDFAFAWTSLRTDTTHRVTVELWRADGSLEVGPLDASPDAYTPSLQDLAVVPSGEVAILWHELAGPHGDPDPRENQRLQLTTPGLRLAGPWSYVVGTSGEIASAGTELVTVAVGGLAPRVVAQRWALSAVADPVSLELGSRFAVEVHWTDAATGASGVGVAERLTASSGTFWFFDPRNPEVAVKVVDGRAINNAFWVFWTALSGLAIDVEVLDRATLQVRRYHRDAGPPSSGSDLEAFFGFPDNVDAPLAAAVPGVPPETAAATTAPSVAGSCSGLPGWVCLPGGLRAQLRWRGRAVDPWQFASAIRLSDVAVAFWFANPDDPQLVLKVLDARSLSGHVWLFGGPLSRAGLQLEVVRDGDGRRRIYRQGLGRLVPFLDARTF